MVAGRMAFLDFGLFKRISADVAEYELQTQRLGIEGRGDELIAHLHRGGWLGQPEYYDPESIIEQFHDLTGWYTRFGDVRELVAKALQTSVQRSCGTARQAACLGRDRQTSACRRQRR